MTEPLTKGLNVAPLTMQQQASLIRAPLHEGLLGTSKAIREVNEMIQRLAQSPLTVLITGESGTGKDIAARLLHRLSPRYGKPFIKVNCPAIPESILESELFGYERGAFTGARTSKPGRFELANHGTIFLDEIVETSYAIQGKLLQILDGEPFMRIGGVSSIKTDVRVLAATNLRLEEATRQGRMREDMYFRLSEVIIQMPPLRTRQEDIPLLTEHFNYNFSAKQGKEYRPIDDVYLAKMRGLPFEGNVRELAARVKKYVATQDPVHLYEEQPEGERAVATPDVVRPEPVSITSSSASASSVFGAGAQETDTKASRKFPPLKEAVRLAVEQAERSLIEEALRVTLWNRRKAAKMLDISYSSLLRRIDAYNIGKTKLE